MPSSRTPEGQPNRCPVCLKEIRIEPSQPFGDAPCPSCGQLLWFPALAGIENFEFLVDGGILHELDITTKSEAIASLVHKLCELGCLSSNIVDTVVKLLMHREESGSTGIGNGVAVPHVKHEAIKQFVGIIGCIPDGIDFDSLDREPVKRIFLLLSPPDKPEEHLRALEGISRILRTTA